MTSCYFSKRQSDLQKEEQAIFKLHQLNQNIKVKEDFFIGYPCNSAFNLERFFEWWEASEISKSPLNDVGNPDQMSSFALNTRDFEREVIQIFSKQANLPTEQAWGFVTTGGTLGNEQGLFIGRETLSKKGEPLLYFSKDSHYSIKSLAQLLKIEFIEIESLKDGSMSSKDFAMKLDPSRPALININLGSTFKGAIDPIEEIAAIAKQAPDCYIHLDAALFGGFLLFEKSSNELKIDFKRQPIDSFSVSGHKFFGSPVPLGFFLCRREHLTHLQGDYIPYIANNNLTIPCSRSTLNTLIWWWTLTTTPKETFQKEASAMIENANYLHQALQELGLPSYLNKHSNTVYFRFLDEAVARKWCLASLDCPQLGKLSHVVVMQHVTTKIIDQFLIDVKEYLHELRETHELSEVSKTN